MTKNVRIENADTSDYKVRVRVQDRNAGGEWVDAPGNPVELNHLTAMALLSIWDNRRLIVEEYRTPTA